MPITDNPNTVDNAFFKPLTGPVAASPYTRPCPEFPDEEFVRLGIQRVLETSESGRAFLQEHGVRFENTPGYSNYFAALSSERRCHLLGDINLSLVNTPKGLAHERLGDIPELADYACFAGDGHWHKARHDGSKMAGGHFYGLNLRTHSWRPLAAGQGLHEHDMSALKRVKPKGPRQGVPQGKRVIIIYDKAGIDFGYWKRRRQEGAVYFISRVNENMVFDWIERVAWEHSAPRHHGVTEDRRGRTREGHLLRIVYYTDPPTGEKYEFLTNQLDRPVGVIVELYRRRWEAEKGFDQIKNKLSEKKAGATSLVAQEAQA